MTPPDRILRSSSQYRAILIALFLAGFASFSALHCVQPMMPVFAQYFQVSPTVSSYPLSIATFTLAFSLLFSGFVSDRIGRKRMMSSALLVLALLLILGAVFAHWTLFLASRLGVGIAVSGVAAVAMTYIVEEIHPPDMGHAMGLYIAGTAIGGMSGRLIAGVMVDFLPWTVAMVTIGLINLLIAWGFDRLLPESQHFQVQRIGMVRIRAAYCYALRQPKLILLFLIGFILMGSLVTVFNYLSYHLLDVPFHLTQTWVGLISITYLAGIYSSPKAAQWGARYGCGCVLPAMLALMLFGLFLLLSDIFAVVCIGLVMFTFGFFAAHSLSSSWVAVEALQYRAVASSIYLFSYYIGSSVLGSSAGLLWESWGWWGICAAVAVVLMLGLWAAWRLSQLSQQSR